MKIFQKTSGVHLDPILGDNVAKNISGGQGLISKTQCHDTQYSAQ